MSSLTDQLHELLDGMRPFPEMEHEQWVIEQSITHINAAADYIDTLEAALTAVKDASAVCEDFEICEHASCNASYTQYAIADDVLAAGATPNNETETSP